jgi:hypothetical protein
MTDEVVYLIEEQLNPSTDFFVLPAILTRSNRVIRCSFADLPADTDLAGAVLVFVRYVPSTWVKRVERMRTHLRKLIFFMDDDLLDLDATVGMPWRYRLKLARLATRRRGWLQRQKAELWVSTPYLQQKYAQWPAQLVLPSPVTGLTGIRRIFYHGTASHGVEIRWLRSVIEEAMHRDKNIVFEIVGGQDVYRLYRDLPRVTIVHPMKWPNYQAFLAQQGRHIGLNPIHDRPFNQARSYTKFFDITRCGAVGIYSPANACADLVSHGQDGWVVELEQEAWVVAILSLAQNESLRQTLLMNAEAKMRELAVKAQHGYDRLPGFIEEFHGD